MQWKTIVPLEINIFTRSRLSPQADFARRFARGVLLQLLREVSLFHDNGNDVARARGDSRSNLGPVTIC